LNRARPEIFRSQFRRGALEAMETASSRGGATQQRGPHSPASSPPSPQFLAFAPHEQASALGIMRDALDAVDGAFSLLCVQHALRPSDGAVCEYRAAMRFTRERLGVLRHSVRVNSPTR
jgi:hypothetical protein